MIATRFRPLTPARLSGIEDPCRHCGYPHSSRPARPGADDTDAPDWARQVTDRWGLCGVSAQVNGQVAGYLTFEPADLVPAVSLPGIGGSTADAFSRDAAVVMALEVCREHRRHGLGRDLVRSAIGQLARRRISQVEAIGTFGRPGIPYADDAAGPTMILLPVGFWQAVGFRIIRPHPSTPTLRLDVSSTARWRPNLAAAWRRVSDLVSQTPPVQPASFEYRRDVDGRQLTDPSTDPS